MVKSKKKRRGKKKKKKRSLRTDCFIKETQQEIHKNGVKKNITRQN
jgi:hypothetical protein